jgi:HD-GYP domain-containing protein (c-di-GMP phosphodiesterase class II)
VTKDAIQPLLATVRALTRVIDAADPHTRGRSLRIARYSVRIARELGLPPASLTDVELGAMLHDLGRYAILNDVALTPRPLDAGERTLIQTHPTIGWEMLRDIPGLEAAAEIVHTHHERPDGKGYPRGLAADRIPAGARIVMVCAAYDAMTEDRPYRRGLPEHAACEELRRHAGTQFFAEVVDVFVRLHESGGLWEDFTREELALHVRRADTPNAA